MMEQTAIAPTKPGWLIEAEAVHEAEERRMAEYRAAEELQDRTARLGTLMISLAKLGIHILSENVHYERINDTGRIEVVADVDGYTFATRYDWEDKHTALVMLRYRPGFYIGETGPQNRWLVSHSISDRIGLICAIEELDALWQNAVEERAKQKAADQSSRIADAPRLSPRTRDARNFLQEIVDALDEGECLRDEQVYILEHVKFTLSLLNAVQPF